MKTSVAAEHSTVESIVAQPVEGKFVAFALVEDAWRIVAPIVAAIAEMS